MIYAKWFYKTMFFALLLVLQSFTGEEVKEEKIKFKKDQWRFICREATASKKLIFVYVGADYCGTCRRIETNLKSNRIGSFYNRNFISARFDAKDLIQHQRAASWGVSAVPTLVFLNEKREVVHLVSGYKDEEELLLEAQLALEKSGSVELERN